LNRRYHDSAEIAY